MCGKRQQTVCFTGHRQIGVPAAEVERRVSRAAGDLIRKGCRYFGAGGARGFDALASEAVLKLREQDPRIHLILVLPFDNQCEHEGNWAATEIEQYHRLRAQASKVVLLAPAYHPGLYYQRNRHLVDHSSVCVAYMTRENSGTGCTVSYARSRGGQVVNLATAV